MSDQYVTLIPPGLAEIAADWFVSLWASNPSAPLGLSFPSQEFKDELLVSK
jgi:hypothetical protein